jgi:hypothetical protein
MDWNPGCTGGQCLVDSLQGTDRGLRISKFKWIEGKLSVPQLTSINSERADP